MSVATSPDWVANTLQVTPSISVHLSIISSNLQSWTKVLRTRMQCNKIIICVLQLKFEKSADVLLKMCCRSTQHNVENQVKLQVLVVNIV